MALWYDFYMKKSNGKKKYTTRLIGKCTLCRKKRPLVLDHNHRTNMARGFICGSCNSCLHEKFDNPKWRERALQYLDSNLGISYYKIKRSDPLNFYLQKKLSFNQYWALLDLKKTDGIGMSPGAFLKRLFFKLLHARNLKRFEKSDFYPMGHAYSVFNDSLFNISLKSELFT